MNRTSKTHKIITVSLSLALLYGQVGALAPVAAQEVSQAIIQKKPITAVNTEPINDSSITAIPPRLEIKVKPGTTIQKAIKIRNESKEVQYLESLSEDFIVDRDGKTPIPVNETVSDRFSLAKWMTVSPTKFMIRPNETQVLDVLIQVPANALPGGHYAMVMHQPAANGEIGSGSSDTKGSTAISQRVGTLIYVTVEGDIHEEAFVRDLHVPAFVENGPVTASFKVENRSDVHIRPQTSIEVTDMFGRLIDTVKVDEKNIFPFSSRDMSAQTTHYWGLGRYTLRVVAPYGDHGKVAYATAAFWMLPYKLVISIGILLGAVAAIWIAIRRHLLHRNDYKAQEIEMLKERIHEMEQERMQ